MNRAYHEYKMKNDKLYAAYYKLIEHLNIDEDTKILTDLIIKKIGITKWFDSK